MSSYWFSEEQIWEMDGSSQILTYLLHVTVNIKLSLLYDNFHAAVFSCSPDTFSPCFLIFGLVCRARKAHTSIKSISNFPTYVSKSKGFFIAKGLQVVQPSFGLLVIIHWVYNSKKESSPVFVVRSYIEYYLLHFRKVPCV